MYFFFNKLNKIIMVIIYNNTKNNYSGRDEYSITAYEPHGIEIA